MMLVENVHLRLVFSSWTIYGTKWCAPTTQFSYREGLGICDARLCLSITLQSALDSGQEAGIVQIDFNAAFDRVNRQGILYKLCSVGIRDSVFSTLTQFRSNQLQHVIVNGCWRKLVNVLSGVPQGSVLGLLFVVENTNPQVLGITLVHWGQH